MKALLLIDLQKQAQDSYHKDQINNQFIENVLFTIRKADEQNIPVIHIITEYTDDNMPLLNHQKGYRFFMKDTSDAEEIKKISNVYKKNHYKIIKHHYDAFWQTDLESLLQKLRVDTLLITGVYTHWCVLSTIFSAMSRNYNITVVRDAVGSRYPDLDELIFKYVLDKKTSALEVKTIDAL